MLRWLRSSEASRLETATAARYVGPFEDQPFPLNPLFRSQPVLSEETKTLIWEKVMKRGEALKAVSAEMSVDIRRIAAVVRLKELEMQWTTEGKQFATPYAKAIMGMLPKTHYIEGGKNQPHEPINDIIVHPKTTQQLFVPTSESRVFTRKDAATSFHESVPTVEFRSPHPELISLERRVLQGQDREESKEEFLKTVQKQEDALARKVQKEMKTEEQNTTRHNTTRFEFRIKNVDSETVGLDGKSSKGTGWRYGVPFDDRRKGAVKIPTSVPEVQ